jgi:hypothetical protein
MPLVNFSALISLLRAFLESRIDDLDRNLMLFTGAVVVGLFLEYAPEFLEKAATSGATWGFRQIPIEARKRRAWYPRWMKPLEVIGAILIVAGVSGELYTESSRSTAETALRGVNESLLAFMRQQASEATAEAARATATAKGFESQIAESTAPGLLRRRSLTHDAMQRRRRRWQKAQTWLEQN